MTPSSMQCRQNFGERTLSISWILKVEEGWGEKEISTDGVVDRREEGGGGEGRGKKSTRVLYERQLQEHHETKTRLKPWQLLR